MRITLLLWLCSWTCFIVSSPYIIPPHSLTSTFLLHCIWATLGYLIQPSGRLFVLLLAGNLAISVSDLHQNQKKLLATNSDYLSNYLQTGLSNFGTVFIATQEQFSKLDSGNNYLLQENGLNQIRLSP